MPLYVVLLILISIDAALLAMTATIGITLEGQASLLLHFKAGLVSSMFTCFIHVLVLFYLIGTGKDVRDAVEDSPDLSARYVPWTREQKRKVFPPACFSTALMIIATLMGGEIHSRVLAAGRGVTFPIRQLPGWWVHVVLVAAALIVTAHAFVMEVKTVKENRRGIEELNAALRGGGHGGEAEG